MAAEEVVGCRMYRNRYPEEGEVVMVRVDKVTDVCAHVSLVEYSDIKAIILLSNLSRKRIRSVAKHIRVGKYEYLRVLRVDEEKGYVDLTKKDVDHDDIIAFQENHKKTKLVHNIIRHISSDTGIESIDIYNMGIWDMYDTYTHALECFLKIVDNPSILDEYQFTDTIKSRLKDVISTKFAAKSFKMQIDFELTCPSFNGIEGIKTALRRGMREDEDVKCHLLTTPIYAASITTFDIVKGKEVLDKVMGAVKKEIRKQGGTCQVKCPPRMVAS